LLGIGEDRVRENIRNLPKKNDYVLVFTGKKLATWFLRGVTPFIGEESALKREGNFNMDLVAEKQIRTPSVHFNIWTNRPEFATTSLGYKLYKVLDDKPIFFWRGRYADGWIGQEASLLVNENYGPLPILKLSSPAFALPNTVTIKKNGAFFARIDIAGTDELTVKLDPATPETATYQFEVAKTVAPVDIGLNADTRKLGLLIRLDRANNGVKSSQKNPTDNHSRMA
jgi:hypothetical protein